MAVPLVSQRPLILGDGIRAVALLAAAIAAWMCLVAGLGTVLLVEGVRAGLVAWIDGLGLTLPGIGTVAGETAVSRVFDRLAMLGFGILPVLLLETAVLGLRDSSVWRICRGRSVSSLTDLALYGLNLLGLWRYACIVLTFGGVFVAGLAVSAIVGGVVHWQMRIHSGSLAVDIVLAFLLFTFCDYWNHRLQHYNPLWPLHRIHHAAEEMTVLTLWRQHPSLSAIEPFIKLWPLALFDIPAGVVATVAMIVVAYEHLIHSNLRWGWGWFGRWVLIPPQGHRLHHHIDPVRQHKNFGIPVLWDRVFGTWDGAAPPDERLGVAGVAYNSGNPVRELWRDLREFAKASVCFFEKKNQKTIIS